MNIINIIELMDNNKKMYFIYNIGLMNIKIKNEYLK